MVVKLVTYATHIARNLLVLAESARRHGFELEVIGLTLKWYGWQGKVDWLETYLRDLDDATILAFIDGYDVLVQRDASEFEREFEALERATGRSLFAQAEDCCYPDASLAPRFPHAHLPGRFINAGVMIGRAGAFRACLDANPHDKVLDDQDYWHHVFLRDPEGVFGLDYDGVLSAAMFGSTLPKWDGRRFVRGRAVPFFLHFPGGWKKDYEGVARQLRIGALDTTPEEHARLLQVRLEAERPALERARAAVAAAAVVAAAGKALKAF